jgi:hypothetical protein
VLYVAKGLAAEYGRRIGDRYMANPHFLPGYLFELAVWTLKGNGTILTST